jgi:hypothetical protein
MSPRLAVLYAWIVAGVSVVVGAVAIIVLGVKAALDSGWTGLGLALYALPWLAIGAAGVWLLDMVQAREDE